MVFRLRSLDNLAVVAMGKHPYEDHLSSPFEEAPRSRVMGGDRHSTTTSRKMATPIFHDSVVRIPQRRANFANLAPLRVPKVAQKRFQQTSVPDIVPNRDLLDVHPLIKNLFSQTEIPEYPPAGRLKFFQKNWAKLTHDPEILNYVSGVKIQFLSRPTQNVPPRPLKMSQEEEALVQEEVEALLAKSAIQKVAHTKDEFLSNIFLVGKKDGGNRPCINLRHLNSFIPYHHFKMEGLHLIKEMLKENDFMCKIDLKMHLSVYPLTEGQEIL